MRRLTGLRRLTRTSCRTCAENPAHVRQISFARATKKRRTCAKKPAHVRRKSVARATKPVARATLCAGRVRDAPRGEVRNVRRATGAACVRARLALWRAGAAVGRGSRAVLPSQSSAPPQLRPRDGARSRHGERGRGRLRRGARARGPRARGPRARAPRAPPKGEDGHPRRRAAGAAHQGRAAQARRAPREAGHPQMAWNVSPLAWRLGQLPDDTAQFAQIEGLSEEDVFLAKGPKPRSCMRRRSRTGLPPHRGRTRTWGVDSPRRPLVS